MTFKRVTKLLSLLVGIAVGLGAVIIAFFTRRLIAPLRQPLWTTPADMGLEFENVNFPAQDSVRLSGWFIPARTAERNGSTIILLHDWTWNRLGDAASDVLSNLSGTTPVELLRLSHALHYEGYHVLMFDLRNHGESAMHPPVTFGLSEANDLLGAIAYLHSRPEVDKVRIGVIGFSMGANAILHALPQTDQIAAAIAVQPMTVGVYAEGYARDLLGKPGEILLPLVETTYSSITGIRLDGIQPAFAVLGGSETPVLFVQCKDDLWGSLDDIERLCTATPHGEGPLYIDGVHRYEGFQYLIENPRVAVTFFERYF